MSRSNTKDVIYIEWCTDDILDAAENCEVELSIEEARSVLHGLDDMHDANCGITWDLIESEILHFVNQRRNKDDE